MPLFSRPEHYPHVRFFQGLDLLYCRLYHRLDVLTPSNLPRHGPAIVASNHTSGLDPFLIQAVTSRKITWMMTRDFYDMPVMGRFFRSIDAIPVNRDGKDTTALRAAFRALDKGEVLGIFPEGRITDSREMLPFQTGVALIANRTKVPVHPVYLDGDQRNTTMVEAFARRHHASIRWGQPLTPAGTLEDMTERLRRAIEALRSVRKRGDRITGFPAAAASVQSSPTGS